jgi:hypothetical protein
MGPFGECRQDQRDLVRGRFQPIQGGVTSGRKRLVPDLAAKCLNALGLAMRAISEEAHGSAPL